MDTPLGYFVGRLGRGRVAALLVGDVRLPSDLGGIAYISMDSGGGWRISLVRELRECGIEVDAARI
jgi:predicted nucleotide-binding protein